MEVQIIKDKIHEIRGHKVMLDFHLAELYETETKRLKEAVRRNISRFPEDFMFELSKEEFENLRTQIASSSFHGGTRYAPFAFTEQGVAMLASVINSSKAIQINIQIVRTFVLLRRYSLNHKDLNQRLALLEQKVDVKFKDIYSALNFLIQEKEQEIKSKERKRIGFKN
ncbi:MAG: ORF6N domain-containing protein [Chitinophagales bacterium]|nr:ORF6N domain-containing protein [Chitinophagales bacterium]